MTPSNVEDLKTRSIGYSLRYFDRHNGHGQTGHCRDLALPGRQTDMYVSANKGKQTTK